MYDWLESHAVTSSIWDVEVVNNLSIHHFKLVRVIGQSLNNKDLQVHQLIHVCVIRRQADSTTKVLVVDLAVVHD